jgi:hypothetical protein
VRDPPNGLPTLKEVVAEAKARGATWKQIGEQLDGIGKQGAQNRFGDGIPQERMDTMPVEKIAAGLTLRSILDALPSDIPLPLDDEDWDAAPPEVAVPYAWRHVAGAVVAFDEALSRARHAAEADLVLKTEMHKSFEMLRRSIAILTSPKAWRAILYRTASFGARSARCS